MSGRNIADEEGKHRKAELLANEHEWWYPEVFRCPLLKKDAAMACLLAHGGIEEGEYVERSERRKEWRYI